MRTTKYYKPIVEDERKIHYKPIVDDPIRNLPSTTTVLHLFALSEAFLQPQNPPSGAELTWLVRPEIESEREVRREMEARRVGRQSMLPL